MLRLIVLVLALANLLFFTWSLGWLDELTGVRARGDREPERLTRQVRADSVRILPLGAIKGAPVAAAATAPATPALTAPPIEAPVALAAPAPAPSPVVAAQVPACLEAGPFTTAQTASVEAMLPANLPEASWTRVRTERSAMWMVYTGKFSDNESLARRIDELRRLKVQYDELRAPSELAPGLSLGRFEVRANANNLLEQLTQRGVRNARVIESTPASSTHMFRFDKPSAQVALQLQALRSEALPRGFQPCK